MDTVTSKNMGVPAIIIDSDVYYFIKDVGPSTRFKHWARNATIVVLVSDPDSSKFIDDDLVSVVVKNTGGLSKRKFYSKAVGVLMEASNLIPVLALIQADDVIHADLEDLGVLVVLHG